MIGKCFISFIFFSTNGSEILIKIKFQTRFFFFSGPLDKLLRQINYLCKDPNGKLNQNFLNLQGCAKTIRYRKIDKFKNTLDKF